MSYLIPRDDERGSDVAQIRDASGRVQGGTPIVDPPRASDAELARTVIPETAAVPPRPAREEYRIDAHTGDIICSTPSQAIAISDLVISAKPAPRLEDHVRIFHAACGGIVTGRLGERLTCAECGQEMTAFVSAAEEES